MRLHTPLSILGITVALIAIMSATVIAAPPTNPPLGGYTGGLFSLYFQRIVQGDGSVGTTSGGVCPIPGQVIGGFSTAPATYGLPICVSPTASDGLASSLTGSLRGTVNYLPKYGATNTGIVNSQIFDNGTNVGIGTITPDASLSISGRTLRVSNLYPEYSWTFGGGTDLNWKKIADITMPATLYSATSMKISVIDANSNFGHSQNMRPSEFFLSARRSSGTMNDLNDGFVAGPIADYVRLVKTGTGVYEVQVRTITNYRNVQITAQVISSLSSTVTYATNPVDGSTTGTIYLPAATNYDNFSNLIVAGGIQAIGGATFGGANGYRFSSPGDTDGGMYSPADGIITFATNNTERIRVLSDGSIGIGTTTAGQKLTVSGSVLGNNYLLYSGDGNGVCFWNDCTQYKISMGVGAEYQYGPVNDYSIKTQVNGSAGRGFTWGLSGVAPVVAINATSGNMQIAGTMTAPTFIGNLTGNAVTATTASGVAWSGVSAKPTTAAGYGITDVVTTAGNQTIAGTKTFSSAIAGSITGNAATATTATTATALQTPRTINGISFNGTANITLPTVNTTGDQTIAGIKTFNSDILVNGNIGVGRGNNSLSNNTRLGQATLQSITTGNYNTAVGSLTLDTNTVGGWNTAMGYDALGANLSGNNNTAYGLNALNTISSANNNTAMGVNAGGNLISGDSNIAIGASTAFPSTSGSNQLNIGNWIYGSGGNIGIGTGTSLTVKLTLQGKLKIVDGTQGTGKVLISDTNGLASWETMPADLPIGTVMAFNDTACPAGWAVADGTSGTPDLRGEFVRGWDPTATVDTTTRWTNKTMTTTGSNVGSWQNATYIIQEPGSVAMAGGTYSVLGGVGRDSFQTHTGSWGINGVATASLVAYGGTRNGFTVRPRNVALLYCMKMTSYATPGDPNTWSNTTGTSSGNVTLATTGMVGVGTNTPTEKLEVAGSIKMVDGNQGTGKILTSDGNGKASWQLAPADLPIGTVMSFNSVSCPAGWAVADGTSGTPDLRGEFVRGLDMGRGVDTGRVVGSSQSGTYTLQKIMAWQNYDVQTTAVGVGLGQHYAWADTEMTSVAANFPTNAKAANGGLVTAGTNYDNIALGGHGNVSDPSSAGRWITQRPRNVALLYCIKVTMATAAVSDPTTWANVQGTASGDVALSTTGNVGVGTTTPTEKLEVQGSIKVVDGNEGTGKVLVSDATGKATWQEMPGDLPVGSIMSFNGATCPAGWVIANGASGTPDLRGEFVRGLDSGRGVDTGRVLGSQQRGSMVMNASAASDIRLFMLTANSNVQGNLGYDVPQTNGALTYTWNQTNGTQGSWAVGTVDTNYVGATRPRNVALLYCMKVSVAPATASNSVTWMNVDGTATGRVALATSGNVGIGTVAPTAKLEVVGSGGTSIDTKLTGRIQLNSNEPGIWYSSGGDTVSYAGRTSSATNHAWGVFTDGSGWNAFNVLRNGNIGIGTSAPLYKLDVRGQVKIDQGPTYDVWIQGGDASSTETRNLAFLGYKPTDTLYLNYGTEYVGGTIIGGNTTITGNATINGGATIASNISALGFYYSSDISLKKDIKKLDSSLEKILKLNGYIFNWKKDGKSDIGVIAQEVEKVFPELIGERVEEDGTKTKTVQYGNLVAPIIEAIKELTSQVKSLHTLIEEQQSDIRKLQSENAELKARIDAIEQALSTKY